MKLHELYENTEVNLIGKRINDKLITSETKNENWDGEFWASSMDLTSLKGCPKLVRGYFTVYDNHITSLEGAPTVITNSFGIADNELTSLKDVHKYIKEIHGTFYADHNAIVSHVLGLLKIKELEHVTLDNGLVQDILNKWLKEPYGNGRVIGAQSDLIDAGLDEFAQL